MIPRVTCDQDQYITHGEVITHDEVQVLFRVVLRTLSLKHKVYCSAVYYILVEARFCLSTVQVRTEHVRTKRVKTEHIGSKRDENET